VTEDQLDPYAAQARPIARTTEDFLREREKYKQLDKGEG
jgi:hypothetical protein